MLSKNGIKIIITMFIIAALFVGYVVFRVHEEGQVRSFPEYSVEGSTLTVNIEGFTETCRSGPLIVETKTSDGWETVVGEAMVGGETVDGGYIEGEYRAPRYVMCDVVKCNEIHTPLTQELTHRVQVGEKEPPEGARANTSRVPVYEKKPLTGTLRLTLEYYTDSQCTDKRTVSKTIER